MCKSCKTTHDSFKLSRGHVVIGAFETPRKDNSTTTKKDLCPNHTEKEVRCYCKSCSIAVCSDCFVTDHLAHKMTDLQDKSKTDEERESLIYLKFDLESLLVEYNKCLGSIKQFISDIKNSAQTSCDAVDKQVGKICCEVRNQAEEIKVQIKKSRDEEVDKMTKRQDEVEIIIEDLKSSRNCVVEDTSIVKILNIKSQIQGLIERGRLRKLDIPDVKCTWFEESAIDKTLIAKQLGDLLFQEHSTFTTSLHFDGLDVEMCCCIKGLPWCIHAEKITTNIPPSLGIYLRLNEYPETADIISCQAERVVTLVNNKDKHQSLKRAEHSDTYPPGKRRGWPRFIDWNRFSDKQNGFLDENNNFTIQTTITVTKIQQI
ncbi:tripartite motif-containing protein 45 [Patella vulgata]|uniref:tripartite motif-containing protein 45 n=1 Tax=Patella vulgata TaxID=6465 RepID=UPI0024A8575C|nr:tripartite motif-containing protein 45 [Patella vulgata]